MRFALGQRIFVLESAVAVAVAAGRVVVADDDAVDDSELEGVLLLLLTE